MTLKELKAREIGLLNSHKEKLIEYGKAFIEIRKMCKNYSGKILSENMLISDIAQEYIKKEKELFNLTKNNNHLIHIKAASELYQKNTVIFDKIFLLLNKYHTLDWELAKNIVKQTSYYDKIKPSTLQDVLNFIEMNEIEK